MRLDYVERRFSLIFANYSKYLVFFPWPFIILPLIITVTLASGLVRHTQAFVKDELDLYTPTDALARQELKQLDSLFHINDSDAFYASRRYDIKRAGYVIVTADVENEDVLHPLAIQATMQLWSTIQSMPVEDHDDHRFTYPSICVQLPIPAEFADALNVFLPSNTSTPEHICVSNPLVEILKYVLVSERSLLNSSIDDITLTKITEVLSIDSEPITHLLGGVTLDKNRQIAGAKAIMLPYALRHCSESEDSIAEKWELKLIDFLLEFHSPIIRVSWWTYETLASESARDREQLKKMVLPCFAVVSLYTIVCCCVASWVRSRPWLAIGGVLSAAMAVISAIGLLLLCGYKMTTVAYSMPFIVFSVGVDNVFILLSAWRATKVDRTLEHRMMDTFSDAALSITVTSMTDIISFAVGYMTPFPSVQMFCAYAAVAVLFTYVYQLTFFAGIMVLTSKREVANRHCLTFLVIKKRPIDNLNKLVSMEKLSRNSDFHEIGYFMKEKLRNQWQWEERKSSSKNHMLAEFFRTTYSDVLLHPIVRMAIIVAFIAYIALAIWGCINVKLGLEPNDLLPDNSYAKRTLIIAEKYFSDYGSFLHVWMYNLSSTKFVHRRIWTTLDKEIELYEHTEFTGISDSWLRHFMSWVRQSGFLITSDSFVHLLKDVFLSQAQFTKYNRDVVFNENGTILEASRVTVQLRSIGARNQSRAMHLFRRLAETSQLQTGVYADFFQFAEQYNAVLPGTLTSIAIAGAAVIVVSLLLIPETIASLWVALTIVSINVGILGFMTFWDVRLDFVSMVTIVMSIGFCVDFASHLAYNFAKGSDMSASQRLRNALYAVGTPILQSASSTILGVSFMASAESYVFRSFLKTIILVVTLGALHGLVVLPVLLTLFYYEENNAEHKRIHRAKEIAQVHRQRFVSVVRKPIPNVADRQGICSIANYCNDRPAGIRYTFSEIGNEQYLLHQPVSGRRINLELPHESTTLDYNSSVVPTYCHPAISKMSNSVQDRFTPRLQVYGDGKSINPGFVYHNPSLTPD